MRRVRIFIISLFFLTVFLFSLDKIAFFFDLSKHSLSSNQNVTKNIEILALKYAHTNQYFPIIRKISSNELFLSAFCREVIRQNKGHLLSTEYQSLVPFLIEKYPENYFLHALHLYKENDGEKDWDNFDPLFFEIAEDPSLNAFTYDILIESVGSEKISSHAFFNLILYLSWKKNFTQVEDLADWGMDNGKMTVNQYAFCLRDMMARKKQAESKRRVRKIQKDNIITSLETFLNQDDIRIDLKENLIKDGSFAEDGLREFWTLADHSDIEPFSKGSYAWGIDSLENSSARIICFFVKNLPDKELSRGGFWCKEPIPLQRKPYLFHFRYKTYSDTERASFWLSYEFSREWILTPTDLEWKHVYLIFDNSQGNSPGIQPFLRMFGTGSVWFDDIYLSEIILEGTSVEKDVFIIQ